MRTPARPELPLVLRKERCQGCTHCIRVCPTEAIRIRHGKAEVMPHRCVQCGRCIRICPRTAWEVRSDSLEKVKRGGDGVAILDPTVFWQFGGQIPPLQVAEAFLQVGFAAVQDLGEALKIYGAAVSSYLSSKERPLPAISSVCPAVVQLVQVKYPSLLENLIPILPPLKIMTSHQKDIDRGNSTKRLYYIVPCLAQARAAMEPPWIGKRVNGAIPLINVYNPLKGVISRKEASSGVSFMDETSLSGMRWAAAGGESDALGTTGSLVVDGIHHVADVLELAESGLLREVPFIESWACTGGCLGGPLTIQDPFLARFHLMAWIRKSEGKVKKEIKKKMSGPMDSFRLSQPFRPRPGMRLDENLKVAMDKLRRIDEVVKKFPGIDCGSCGCPNCLALAEDIVQGHAQEGDCLYVLKRKSAVRPRRKIRGSRLNAPKKDSES